MMDNISFPINIYNCIFYLHCQGSKFTMSKQPSSAQEWLAKANQSDDPAEQIRCCAQALELDPEFALAYFLRGNGYANLRQNDKAIAGYDQALHLDPQINFIN